MEQSYAMAENWQWNLLGEWQSGVGEVNADEICV
jgi:hypothetical protein